MGIIKRITFLIVICSVICSRHCCLIYADYNAKVFGINNVDNGVNYIYFNESEPNAISHLSYLLDKYTFLSDDSFSYVYFYRMEMLDNIDFGNKENTDILSKYLIIEESYKGEYLKRLLSFQNPDGGFGLAKNYQSDILDTKIALKALQYLGQKDEMTDAIRYIFSTQNVDGGFSYQPGLKSNAELSSDIANILADCFNEEMNLQKDYSSELEKLRSYLDRNAVALSNLSSDNLDKVYQHFYTALFKLKMDNEYDITDYYNLQAEDGSVFEDSLATAIYLELMVREKNTIKASINNIVFTNDEGDKASVYNSYENVNIAVESAFDSEEGYLTVDVETPDGDTINLDTDNLVFNTADNKEGTYRVTAKVINSYNNQVAAKYTNAFTINKTFAADDLQVGFYDANNDTNSLGDTIQFAHKGDVVTAKLLAKLNLKNLDESTEDIVLNWSLTRKTTKVAGDKIVITRNDEGKFVYGSNIIETAEYNVFKCEFNLGDYELDTKESCSYILEADITMGENTLKNAVATFIVSGQEMSILTNTDKEELIASEDDANISVNIREKKVVDIVLATGTEDAAIANRYVDKIEEIRTDLEKLGYTVNVGATKSTHYTAKDTFAWQEYDHIDYQEPYSSFSKYNIPKHIIYEEDGIRMIGYCQKANKDFLYLEGNNESKKILEFEVKKEDGNNWHTIDGAGFLFNTKLDETSIEGYSILLRSNGIYLYKINNNKLDAFRNGSSNSRKELKKVTIKNVNDAHHIKLVVENDLASVYDNDVLIMDKIAVGEVDGDGYGPITFHGGHCCSQISSFKFSNISMKAIGGQKFEDILKSYNFESYDSRYVINLSDTEDENLVTEADNIKKTAKDKNISLLTVGNDKNRDSYNVLYNNECENEPVDGAFYEISDDTTLDAVEQYIISKEEGKYVINKNGNVVTDLVFTGTLYDGSAYTKKFDRLYEGEQISLNIPQTITNLVVGQDAPLLKDITLTFKDALGKTITTTANDVYLPVTKYTDKFTNKVMTDSDEYTQYNNAVITHRVNNKSDKRTGKNLVSVINIKDSEGNVVETFSKELPEIMVSSNVEHAATWNTAENKAGEYTVEALVYDGNYLVTKSEKTIIVTEIDASYAALLGNLTLSQKILKNTDELKITKNVKNEFKKQVNDAKEVIRIVKADTNESVYENETAISLDAYADTASSETVVAVDDFSVSENGEYYIYHEVVLSDGRIIALEGDGFILDTEEEVELGAILGDGALISLNSEAGVNGIELDGAIITVGGTMHSNTNIEVNTSILNISNTCEAVLPITLNAMVTNIASGTRICGSIDVPVLDKALDKDNILIESPVYDNYTDKGVLLASEGDITIRSSSVRFKGLIYAPNGTVTIESASFNMEGRIIAKNIVYKGSVLNVSSYDGDLDLLK